MHIGNTCSDKKKRHDFDVLSNIMASTSYPYIAARFYSNQSNSKVPYTFTLKSFSSSIFLEHVWRAVSAVPDDHNQFVSFVKKFPLVRCFPVFWKHRSMYQYWISVTHFFMKVNTDLEWLHPFSPKPTKWSNTLKQLFECVWPICGIGT